VYNRDKIIAVMQQIYDESKVIKPYVVVAQPRRIKGETPAQNFDGHHGLHTDFLGHSHGFVNIYGEKVDVARNYLIEQAIESGAKYMFFIGEDTVVPWDAFDRLHKTAEANPHSVITGVYYIKLSNAMIMVKNNDWISIPNVDPGQLIEAWQTGMDCMLIPIELLKEMKAQDPEIPFCCIGTNIGEIPFIGEDNFFVHRLHKMGIKLLVDTNVQCLHIDLASGKYTAHPSVDLRNYQTNIPITTPLTWEDKQYIDDRWVNRLPKGSNHSNTNVEDLIAAGLPVKFNMGCGRDQIPGYIGVDKYNPTADMCMDLMDLNLPENSVDEILASHVIEHVSHVQAHELLGKWHTALKPGAQLIMEMPDLESLCADFAQATHEERAVITMCIYGACANYMSPETIAAGTASPHVWGYYPSIMQQILQQVGFHHSEVTPQQGAHPGKNFRVVATK